MKTLQLAFDTNKVYFIITEKMYIQMDEWGIDVVQRKSHKYSPVPETDEFYLLALNIVVAFKFPLIIGELGDFWSEQTNRQQAPVAARLHGS